MSHEQTSRENRDVEVAWRSCPSTVPVQGPAIPSTDTSESPIATTPVDNEALDNRLSSLQLDDGNIPTQAAVALSPTEVSRAYSVAKRCTDDGALSSS